MPSTESPRTENQTAGKQDRRERPVKKRKHRAAGDSPERAPRDSGPTAVVSRRAAERLRAGHVWVYSSDVEKVIADKDGIEPTGLYTVVDQRGMPLGTALYSSTSQIALRLVSTAVLRNRESWLQLLRTRLEAAIELRQEMLYSERGRSNATRLVFSEADALPGLILDKYGDLVILQLLTQGMDRDDVRAVVVEVLQRTIDPATIIERPDPRIREIEQLSAPSESPLYIRESAPEDSPRPESNLSTIFQLNGLRFHYDANTGQKTGAFLDQRENYAAAARHAHGDALDVCTYHGGFALHLAQVCPRVTGVDASRPALEVAESNLDLNREALGLAGESAPAVDWVEANAFDLLRDWSASGPAYDTVVLDPPAFAKSKKAVEGALRGYKEMNLRALKLLRPGGTLVTCSCSQQISSDDFTAVVAAAAGDAGRRLRLIERRGAASDHPVILTIPETDYLKCLICRVE